MSRISSKDFRGRRLDTMLSLSLVNLGNRSLQRKNRARLRKNRETGYYCAVTSEVRFCRIESRGRVELLQGKLSATDRG